MTESVHHSNLVQTLSQRLKRQDNATVEHQQNLRLMFEKMFLEYKQGSAAQQFADHAAQKPSESGLADSKQDSSLKSIDDVLVQLLEQAKALPAAPEASEQEEFMNKSLGVNLSVSNVRMAEVSPRASVQSGLSIQNSVHAKAQPVFEASPSVKILAQQVAELEPNSIRLVKAENGFHLVIRDQGISKEALQWLLSNVQHALSRGNSKLTAMIVNGEEMWRQNEYVEAGAETQEGVERVYFDKQY